MGHAIKLTPQDLVEVCDYLRDLGIEPEVCAMARAAMQPGVPTPSIQPPPATFTPRAPTPGAFLPTPEPGATPLPTAGPGAAQLPTVQPGVARLPVQPTPSGFDPVQPGPGAFRMPAPTPGVGGTRPGSVVLYPQMPGPGAGAGFFTGVTAGTYTFPSTITVDAKGRIVSIEAGDTPETSDLCLTSFLVSPSTDGAPYQEIQTAYDAAVAAGHGIDSPAQVLVCPGDYTEDVTMSVAGIDILAVAPNKRQPNVTSITTGLGITRLLGVLSIRLGAESTAERTTAAWRGIDVIASGATENAVDIDHPAVTMYMYISDCKIQSENRSALILDSTNSVIDMQRCDLSCNTDGFAVINANDGAMFLFACGLRSPVAVDTMSGLLDAGRYEFEQCTLIGKATCNTPAVTFIDSILEPRSSESLSINSGGTATFIRSEVQAAATGNMFTGDGDIVHDALTFGANGRAPWATTLTVTSLAGLPQEQPIQLVGFAFEVTSQTALSVVGPNTLTLPPLSGRPGPIFVKEHLTSTGVVTVSAQAGEAIRVGTAAAALTIQVPRPNNISSGGVFLIANVTSGYWEAFFVGGQGAPCVTSYTVSPTAGMAHFTSIQDAYNEAKADGHDESSPAKVLVCPGIYTEDITMDQAGIDIIAIAQDPYNELRGFLGDSITRLVGNLTIDLSTSPPSIANNTGAWRGIDIDLESNPGAARAAIRFIGTSPQRAYISDCRIGSRTDDVAVLGTNSGSDSVLDFVQCGIIQSQGANGAPPTIIDWDDGTIELDGCSVFGSAIGELADTELGSEFFATRCRLIGNWDVAGDVVCRHCVMEGGIDITNASGTFEVTHCEMDTFGGGGGQLVTGSGTFTYDRISWSAGSIGTFNTPGSGLTTVQIDSTPDASYYQDVTPNFTITAETNIVAVAVGGGSITMPPATARGGPIRLKNNSGGGVNAVPAGAETINGAGGAHAIPAAGETYVSDGVSNWEVIA